MEYNILENAIFVPISAKIGTNLNILKQKIIGIVLKQKDIENNRYIEEDERLKLEQEEKMNKLKERRNNDNSNINENKIKILNANGRVINKTNVNEKQSIVQTEKEKEKEEEEEVFDEMYQFRQNSSSAGVLLDIEKSRKLGTTLHVVIRRGEVRQNQRTFFFNNLRSLHKISFYYLIYFSFTSLLTFLSNFCISD